MARNYTSGQKQTTNSQTSIKEEEPHIKTLSLHKQIYDTYIATGELINFHPHIRQEVAEAYRVEFPNYTYNVSCGECIVEMLVTVYKWYYEKIRS